MFSFRVGLIHLTICCCMLIMFKVLCFYQSLRISRPKDNSSYNIVVDGPKDDVPW